jgi:hypothetical protein
MRSKLMFPSGMLYKQASTKELKTIPREKTILSLQPFAGAYLFPLLIFYVAATIYR